MSFDMNDWNLIKGHVQDLVQVEAEAAANAHLTVQVELLTLLMKKGLISQEEVSILIQRLEALAGMTSKTSPSVGHYLSLWSLLLREAFQLDRGNAN